jgi:hypothetical protein
MYTNYRALISGLYLAQSARRLLFGLQGSCSQMSCEVHGVVIISARWRTYTVLLAPDLTASVLLARFGLEHNVSFLPRTVYPVEVLLYCLGIVSASKSLGDNIVSRTPYAKHGVQVSRPADAAYSTRRRRAMVRKKLGWLRANEEAG